MFQIDAFQFLTREEIRSIMLQLQPGRMCTLIQDNNQHHPRRIFNARIIGIDYSQKNDVPIIVMMKRYMAYNHTENAPEPTANTDFWERHGPMYIRRTTPIIRLPPATTEGNYETSLPRYHAISRFRTLAPNTSDSTHYLARNFPLEQKFTLAPLYDDEHIARLPSHLYVIVTHWERDFTLWDGFLGRLKVSNQAIEYALHQRQSQIPTPVNDHASCDDPLSTSRSYSTFHRFLLYCNQSFYELRRHYDTLKTRYLDKITLRNFPHEQATPAELLATICS